LLCGRHNRGCHGCFLFVDYSVYPLLANRSASSRSISVRVVALAAFPPCGNRRSRSSRSIQCHFHASCPPPPRSAGHLSGLLRTDLVNLNLNDARPLFLLTCCSS